MNVLVIAPHADDEILGVGGTMAKYIAQQCRVFVCIATKGSMPIFDDDYVAKLRVETHRAHNMLKVAKTFFFDFPAVMLEQIPRYEINQRILDVIQEVEPDVVYIPHFGDMQKDHQIIAEAAMVAVRPKYHHKIKAIYSYETLSETEWSIPHNSNTFIPAVYVDVSDYIDNKIEVMRQYASQLSDYPNPRSLEAIKALAMYRGSTVNVHAAEAFMLIREIK